MCRPYRTGRHPADCVVRTTSPANKHPRDEELSSSNHADSSTPGASPSTHDLPPLPSTSAHSITADPSPDYGKVNADLATAPPPPENFAVLPPTGVGSFAGPDAPNASQPQTYQGGYTFDPSQFDFDFLNTQNDEYHGGTYSNMLNSPLLPPPSDYSIVPPFIPNPSSYNTTTTSLSNSMWPTTVSNSTEPLRSFASLAIGAPSRTDPVANPNPLPPLPLNVSTNHTVDNRVLEQTPQPAPTTENAASKTAPGKKGKGGRRPVKSPAIVQNDDHAQPTPTPISGRKRKAAPSAELDENNIIEEGGRRVRKKRVRQD